MSIPPITPVFFHYPSLSPTNSSLLLFCFLCDIFLVDIFVLTVHRRYSSTSASSSAPATSDDNMYTASFAFFEALWDAGITNCFVNLGSDHPSILEAMVKGQKDAAKFPRIITCPNEVKPTFTSLRD